MIEQISSEAEIENLYKIGSNAPYTPVKNGYGYYGVLISHKENGKIHCHLCGKFYGNLGSHIANDHNMPSKDYKKKFGFSMKQPLCSSSMSAKLRTSMLKNIADGKIKPEKNSATRFRRGKKVKYKRYRTMANLNKNSICPEQVKEKVLAIGEHLGHFPTVEEMREEDGGLYNLICRRFGNWNNWKRKNNFPTIEKKRVTKRVVICAVHKYLANGKVKGSGNEYAKFARIHNLPSLPTVIRHLGSQNRMFHAAGFNVKG